ncbi:hypothetical protein [Fusibacter sp. 3D3]|uniref:hypothetical protein n=1 Tax=Fusibacter sp. 3D3 TaxID=1048380 RepID=UPI0008537C9F|nr:hypothetical protein [Fusibacter sp. 3D3]GAU75885.1 hypothetical protein F3D3_0481 [Fusibacter sp. 3D3]
MTYEIDQIVKRVLHKLGQLKKVNIISNLNYSVDLKNQLEQAFFIEEKAILDTGEKEIDVWIPELTCKQLMSVYQGLPVDALSEIVIEALLKGYKIVVLKASVELLNIQAVRTPFINRYFEALGILEQSGLNIKEKMDDDNLEPVLKAGRRIDQSQEVVSKCVDLNQKVLTESQLIHYLGQNIEVVNVNSNAIITPSAQDFLRQNPIRLNRK